MFHYLQAFSSKKDAPHEHELQMDLYAFLASNGYAEIEITAVSSGRVDIYLPQPGFRFIVEVKRTFEGWVAELHKFVGQTAAYQQTDVRLGVLSVLDLTARKAGEPHFDRCFEVHDREFASDDKRRVVVMRVPGNRRPPCLQTAVVAIK
jgi:hypothetical protein